MGRAQCSKQYTRRHLALPMSGGVGDGGGGGGGGGDGGGTSCRRTYSTYTAHASIYACTHTRK